jgi:guanyl-specific ribonuclease Sa
MTRWLAAAKAAQSAPTKPTKPTQPGASDLGEVKSEKSVLSGPPVSALEQDAHALLAQLEREGPQTYGAAAVALGIGATRAVAAETALRRAGRIRLGPLGEAVPLSKETRK